MSWVERIDPVTLEPLQRSVDLPGGPTWPGGIAAHADGSLHVVFGNHAHRLSASLDVLASTELPRRRPYNSFVTLPDGHLATKDFGGARPGIAGDDDPCELLVLHHEHLGVLARLTLPEPSTARLSADGDHVMVVGDTTLWTVRWTRTELELEPVHGRYVTMEGQTYGWDAVVAGGAAWFLDDGAGSERYAGTFRGIGTNAAPLHLVRVDLADGSVQCAEVCGRPGGLVANPPAIDVDRAIAIAYDSGNGVVTAFAIDERGIGDVAWRRDMNHAAHVLLLPETGHAVLCDFDTQRSMEVVVVVDVTTGHELVRADTGMPVQSVLFPAPGFANDVYVCSFAGVCRIAFD